MGADWFPAVKRITSLHPHQIRTNMSTLLSVLPIIFACMSSSAQLFDIFLFETTVFPWSLGFSCDGGNGPDFCAKMKVGVRKVRANRIIADEYEHLTCVCSPGEGL